jgi:hypothetical protein
MKDLCIKAILMTALTAGMLGCEKDGPAENAGEKIDQTTTDVGNKIEDKCEEAKKSMGADDTRC